LSEKTILFTQLSNLSSCGINEIIMVVGYYSEKIIDFSKKNFPNLKFRFLQNDLYATTNTLHSLWIGTQRLNDDFVLLNGDVVFSQNVLRSLLDSRYETCLAIHKHKVGEEEVKVLLHDDLILEIGKQLQSFEADGEFTGVAKFSKKDCQAMKTKLSKIVKNAGSCNYFEYAVDSMLEKHDIYAVDVSNFPVIEVDTKEDLEQARNLFKI
jgi:choline kinase